jgi:hypothetical protein
VAAIMVSRGVTLSHVVAGETILNGCRTYDVVRR